MEELVLVLGSVAGACTAVAMDKFPRGKYNKLSSEKNPIIKNQIHSLNIEKEILTKTISRLYQQTSELSKINRDKLLLRYQHQLGLVITKIEKLEAASKHPDLGPLGDGLITLMDQKMSQLDQRLHEISSKITVTNPLSQVKDPEPHKEILHEKPITKIVDTKIADLKPKEIRNTTQQIEIPVPENHTSVELITLTEIPKRIPEFPPELVKKPLVNSPTQETEQKDPGTLVELERPKNVKSTEIAQLEHIQPSVDKKIQIPATIKIPEEEKIEDDDKDIDKIKNEIMKALSKLEQVEVE